MESTETEKEPLNSQLLQYEKVVRKIIIKCALDKFYINHLKTI